MRLPKLLEEQSPLKNQYFEIIKSKNSPKKKIGPIIYDWQLAQINLINKLSNQENILQKLIQLQKQFKNCQIPRFYSYFFIKSTLGTNHNIIDIIEKETQLVKNKQSKYHKIINLIKIRQNLLLQIQKYCQQKNKQIYQKLDDLRFLNLEIIHSISKWKQQMGYSFNNDNSNNSNANSQQPIVFMENGANYLVKMINDNISIIQSFNQWKNQLIYPPNPFFLDENGKYQGITNKQKLEIDNCMEVLAKQKAQELRCIINPPKYISKYTYKTQQQQLNSLRSQLENQKNYKIQQTYKNTFRKASLTSKSRKTLYQQPNKQKISQKWIKNNPMINLITNSQIGVLKQVKKKISPLRKSSSSFHKRSPQNKYKQKIDLLRNKVQQNYLSNQKKNQALKLALKKPKVKQVKPKIKLIGQKQSIVQTVVNALLPSKNLQMYKSMQVRKSASFFFKSMEKIEQVNQEKQQIDIKPVTQHNRAMSMSTISQKIFNQKKISKPIISKDLTNYYFSKNQQKKLNQNKLSKSKEMKSLSMSPSKKNKQKIMKTEQSVVNIDNTKNVDQQLRIVKARLKQLAIRKVYQQKQKVPRSRAIPYQQELVKTQKISPKEQKKQLSISKIKNMPNKSKKIPATKQIIKQSNIQSIDHQQLKKMQQLLNQKNNQIQLLTSRLKHQNISQKKQIIQRIEKQRQQKKQQFEKLKKRIQLQNVDLLENVKKQQQKFLKMKQQQYKLKSQQLKQQYQKNLKIIKNQYDQKNKLMEKKVQEQQKLKKQIQLKAIQQKRKLQEIQMKIKQKQIKQQLLLEILQQQKRKQQIQQQQNNQLKYKIQQQLKLKQQIQKEILKNMEEQNQKLQKFYQKIQKQNLQVFQQTKQIENQINKIKQESIQEKDIIQSVTIKEQHNLLQEQQNKRKKKQQQQLNQQNNLDLQELKLRVKQEILEAMIKNKQEEQQQQKKYQEIRKKRIQQIQNQIKNNLKKQQKQLDQIKQKIILKSQNQHNQQEKKLQFQQPQNYKIKKQQQSSSIEIKDKLIQPQQQHKQIKQQKKIQENKKQQDLNNINQNQEFNKQTDKIQQSKHQLNIQKQEENKQQKQLNQSKIQKQQQNLQKIQKQQTNIIENKTQNIEKTSQKQIQSRLILHNQQIEKIKDKKIVEIKQDRQEILIKYQNIQQYLTKCKQIYLEDIKIQQYLINFYNKLDHQVKQMQPYSINQLTKIMIQKKVDIYDCNSIGWLENDNYKLIGNFGCIENIVKKYGDVQIEIKYIFIKNNPYQKKFLTNQIKIFEKIGYIYQKKLPQQGKFSIKFILKIPKQIVPKNLQKLNNRLLISSLICIQKHQNHQQKQIHSKIFVDYLLSQTLKNNLNNKQLAQFTSSNNFDDKQLLKRVFQTSVTNNIISTNHIDDNKTEIQIKLALNYIQFYQYPSFVFNTIQYGTVQDQKIYVGKISDNISIVILSPNLKDFSMEVYLQSRTNNLKKQRQVLLCLPVWQSSNSYKLNLHSPKDYIYRQKISPNLYFGSIINTTIQREDYKLVQPPFIFSIFQNNDVKIPIRPLFATTVEKQQTIKFKK